MKAHPPRIAGLIAVVLAAASLTACTSASTASNAPASPTADAQYPLTIDNCGSDVTLTHAPQRIVMVNNDALATLEALDAVDRVVAVTATPQAELYQPATVAMIDKLSVLSTQKNATGGSIVSQESILGAQPDLVIAPESAVDRAALTAAGIPVYSPSAYCQNPPPAYTQTATFQRVWDELTIFGAMLGVPELAASAIADAQAELGSTGVADKGTAAALYVSSGGTTLSPYGGPSMVTPVFAAAGLQNVYTDTPERVFDASLEDLLSRDPHTIVLLYSGGDPQATIDAFLSAPGVSGLSAVQGGRVVALAFPYTDPPSVLSTRGPAELSKLLAELP